MLVSDHVVKLKCFTVRDDFFAFPIDFFWGLPPSLYADQVLCAASRAALPPIYYSGGAKIENDKALYKCMKRFFMQQVLKSWALVQARAQFSCFFYNSR